MMQVVVVAYDFQILSSKETLISIVRNIKFVDDLISCVEDNYDKTIVSYKEDMIELIKKKSALFQPKTFDDYKTKYQTIIKAVGGK